MKSVTLCILLLTLNPTSGICQPTRQLEPVVIKVIICAEAVKYDIAPAFAIAVAHVESRKGYQEFRVGQMGRSAYYGPMGINKCFRQQWRVDLPETNIAVGCYALRGVGNSVVKLKRRLMRYNTSFDLGYWKAVMKAVRKYRAEGWA